MPGGFVLRPIGRGMTYFSPKSRRRHISPMVRTSIKAIFAFINMRLHGEDNAPPSTGRRRIAALSAPVVQLAGATCVWTGSKRSRT